MPLIARTLVARAKAARPWVARQSRGAPTEVRRQRAMATATAGADASAPPAYSALAAELREIDSIVGVDAILSWDELVIMKEKSASSRAAQKATLASILHEKQTSERLGELICGAETELGALDPMRAASVRDARRSYDRKVRMPADLAREEARLGSEGYQAWAKAREANDYESFKPVLAKIVQLRKDESAAVAPDQLPYDYQIDKFERGMKRERLAEIFDELKEGLVPLIKEITSAPQLKINKKITESTFDVDKQEALCEKVMEKLGFDGILSRSVHPFTGGTAADVRITTRYDPHDFVSGVAGLVHETGHALYEQNRPSGEFEGLPASEALSMGIHESMSLLFERMVGQNEAFWTFLQPDIVKSFGFMSDVTVQEYFEAVNKVEKSLIRVDADELTYPLHIIIRFELEAGLFDGSVTVENLPEKWNSLYKRYLDIDVPSNKEGCLQDVHWSDGSFGYFPSYTLGAIFACQFFQHAERSIPSLSDDMREGNFDKLRAWLKDNIHSKGSLYPSADELCEAVTGSKLDPTIYLDYLRAKYRRLYGLQ